MASTSRWLVGSSRQQHVAAGEEDAGDLDAAPLAAGEHADREVLPRRVEAEAGGDRPGLALGGVATVGAEQLLGPAVAGDGALVGVLLHGDAQLLDALDLGVDAAPGEHVGDRGAGVGGRVDPRVLGQVAEAALADHPPGGRLGLTAEDAEQAGLAGAVAADEADLVLGHDREVGPLDDEAAADRHGETLACSTASSLAGRERSVPTRVSDGFGRDGLGRPARRLAPTGRPDGRSAGAAGRRPPGSAVGGGRRRSAAASAAAVGGGGVGGGGRRRRRCVDAVGGGAAAVVVVGAVVGGGGLRRRRPSPPPPPPPSLGRCSAAARPGRAGRVITAESSVKSEPRQSPSPKPGARPSARPTRSA